MTEKSESDRRNARPSRMDESRLPPSDEWRCVRCALVLPSPGEGRPPISCLSELGGCGRETTCCEHDAPVEGCETCAQGHTRFFPASWGEAHVQLYIDAEMDPYRRLIDFYRRTFRTEDTAPLDACLATVATGASEGDALWVYVVGAPSSGKTEILRAFREREPKNETTYYLSSLTPNSLVSGLKDGKHLLPDLDGKTLIVKDFTMTLEMHRENRDALFGALRDAYDGSFSKAFGSVGTVGFDSHFNLLAAVTNAIDSYYTVQSILGQRFLMVRTSFPEDFDTDGERDIGAVRDTFARLVREALKAREGKPLPPCPNGFKEDIKSLAREIAILRTHVHREGQGREIASIPEPEAPARLTNQLLKIVRGVAKVRAHSDVMDEDMEIARRVAHDTIPAMMMEILKAIHDGTATTDALAQLVRLSRQTVERRLEDLTVLRAIEREEQGRLYVYHLPREFSFLRAVEPTNAEIGEADSGAGGICGPKLKAISDHIRNKLRWDGGRPDSWIARDAILAFQLSESSASDLEEFVASMRKGMAE